MPVGLLCNQGAVPEQQETRPDRPKNSEIQDQLHNLCATSQENIDGVSQKNPFQILVDLSALGQTPVQASPLTTLDPVGLSLDPP